MTDPLRPPDTDEEPWPYAGADIEGGAQAYTAAWLVATVAVLAGLTLAAIAWRVLR